MVEFDEPALPRDAGEATNDDIREDIRKVMKANEFYVPMARVHGSAAMALQVLGLVAVKSGLSAEDGNRQIPDFGD